jgi:hypothetical protein
LGCVRYGDTLIAHPLTKGAKNRVMRLRGYGNAISPQVAATVLQSMWGE